MVSRPLNSGQIVQSTSSVTDDIVLTTVQDNSEIRDNSLRQQEAVVSDIAETDIRVEIEVGLVNTVLVLAFGIDTVSSLGGRKVKPVRIWGYN